MTQESQSYTLPILPLKGIVVYPHLAIPLTLHDREKILAVESALKSPNKLLAVFSRTEDHQEDNIVKELAAAGTVASVQLLARQDDSMQIIIQALERVDMLYLTQSSPFLKAQVQPHPLLRIEGIEKEALQREFLELSQTFLALSHPHRQLQLPPNIAPDDDVMQLLYPMAKLLQIGTNEEQQLLESDNDINAIRLVNSWLTHEIQILEIRKEFSDKAHKKISSEQRRYLIKEQIRALQHELGEQAPEQEGDEETDAISKRLKECQLPQELQPEIDKNLARLKQIPPSSPEYQVALSHLELVADLPWQKSSPDNLDLEHARTILDADHFGLEEIKDRIIEYLAVMQLNPSSRAPILCLIGPPGVGKTSLGQSIARALGRKFEHFSLGGLHDEAELRGHRRTYIGAMPGRLIQALRRAGVRNPLIMLDEIDKLGRDYRGDPAAALMEILDPAQNNSFRDNYLNLPFDLSHVFFITTANNSDTIPKPLLDRMEILRLSGYTDQEKCQIALRYLLPRQRSESGLQQNQLSVSEQTIAAIINGYTREAGVRELERMLARIARKLAVEIARDHDATQTINTEQLEELLGPQRFIHDSMRRQLPAGVAAGLAWTESGGDVLYIEIIALNHSESLTLTGHLGEIMKESALTANSLIKEECRSRNVAAEYGPVHIHVPAGAIPKDGPSAGLTIAVALASLYSQQPVRSDTAMTGEITLTGLILPVGGIKEKILAAHRAGLKRIIVPEENRRHVSRLPEEILQSTEIIYVATIDAALTAAIANWPQPNGEN